ncbi:MAG TPA: SurA N-terminal domain-containing protein [Pseudolabrys sp.]|nr:SurA N-terminal domain-containing protein [Pseudolabrys sp.]
MSDLKLSAFRVIGILLVAAAAMVASPRFAAAQVVAMVNGVPITALDVQRRMKLIQVSTHKAATRKEALQALIDDQVKIAAAKPFQISVGKSEVDNAFASMAKRSGLTAEQFAQQIERAGISVEALKARLKADLTWDQLVRGRFQSSLRVTDADVTLAIKNDGKNDAEASVGYIYRIYPIMIVVPNGSSAAIVERKRKEAEELRARFDNCKEGLAMARALRDGAVRAPVMRTSSALPEKLRQILDTMPLGHLTAPEMTAQGIQMFALCSRTQSAEDAPIRSETREKIFNKRFAAESKRYLEEARKSAMIEYK